MTEYEAWLNRTLVTIAKLPVAEDPLDWCIAHAEKRGLWLEFGVYKGASLRRMAEGRGEARVVGFDSFRGLPEAWHGNPGNPAGAFALESPPEVPGAELVVGLFDATLPAFPLDAPVTLLHVDCDIYPSTVTVLTHIIPHLALGSLVVFDELIAYESYENHEIKALYEAEQHGFSFEWLCRSNGSQVAISAIQGP